MKFKVGDIILGGPFGIYVKGLGFGTVLEVTEGIITTYRVKWDDYPDLELGCPPVPIVFDQDNA